MAIALAVMLVGLGGPNADVAPRPEAATESAFEGAGEAIPPQVFERYFTANAGQLQNQAVRYYASAGGVDIGFADGAVLMNAVEPRSPGSQDLHDLYNLEAHEAIHARGVLVRMTFEGANPVAPQGRGELPLRSHFFLGSDPSAWRTDVRSYREVVYENLYEGIDLVYRLGGDGAKSEFRVAPGADPAAIRIAVDGVDGVRLEGDRLVFLTSAGDLGDAPVAAWDSSGGVPCRHEIRGARSYGFSCGARDPDTSLVIDPLTYSTFLGDWGRDEALDLAVDREGGVRVIGQTASPYFPATPGAYDTCWNGDTDAFVARLDASGANLLSSTFLGGIGRDVGTAIEVDWDGFTYVTGMTESPDFPVTTGAYDTTLGGYGDAFVVKLSEDESGLVYSTFLGGERGEWGVSIALWRGHGPVVAGNTNSEDFPVTAGAFDTSFNGGYADVFVAALNYWGMMLEWATYFGGSGEDSAHMTVDSSNNVYLAGSTQSADLPLTAGAFDPTLDGMEDAFFAKLDWNGAALLFSSYLGGSGDWEAAYDVAVDPRGVVLGGVTTSPDFPTTPGAYDGTYNGGAYQSDAFVARVDWASGDLMYATYLGGPGWDDVYAVVPDPSGSVYVAGRTSADGFPVTPDAYDGTYNGGIDAIVAKLDANGSLLLYSSLLGGAGDDVAYAIALDHHGAVYLAGEAGAEDFPTTPGAFQTTYGGGWDAFAAKLSVGGVPSRPAVADAGGPYEADEGSAVAFDGSNSTGSVVTLSGGLPEMGDYSCPWPAVGHSGWPDEPSPPFMNLIANADFEDGLDGWSPVGSVSIATGAAHNGSSSLLVDTTAGGPGYVSQDLGGLGPEYVLFGWVKKVSVRDDDPLTIQLVRNWNSTTGSGDVAAAFLLMENHTLATVWSRPAGYLPDIPDVGWHRLVLAVNEPARVSCAWYGEGQYGSVGYMVSQWDRTPFRPDRIVVGDNSTSGIGGKAYFDHLILVSSEPGSTEEATIASCAWDFDDRMDSDGDGDVTNDVDATGVSPTHVYGDDGLYVVTLKVTDTRNEVAWDTATVAVRNVAPAIDFAVVPSGDEGDALTFQARITDPGSDDLTVAWWGPCTGWSAPTVYPNDPARYPDPHPSPDVNPRDVTDTQGVVCGDNGAYDWHLRVTDDDGGMAAMSGAFSVDNLPPSLTVSPPSQVAADEGTLVALNATAVDMGSDDLTFAWAWQYGPTDTAAHYNDGVGPDPPNSPNGTYPFTARDDSSFTYGDDGAYSVGLTVTDDDGARVAYATTILMVNVSPTVEAGADQVSAEGSVLPFTFSFSDPGFDQPAAGTVEDFTAKVDWGDTTSQALVVNEVPGGPGVPTTGTIPASHVYADNGVYVAAVTVCDDDGGCGQTAFSVTVNNVPPMVTAGLDQAVDEASPVAVSFAFSDPGFDFPQAGTWENFTATVDWGYGPPGAASVVEIPGGPGVPTTGFVNLTHVYGDDGVFPVTATVCDDDGGCGSASLTVTLANVAPTISDVEAYVAADVTLRVAGEKWHDVRLALVWNGNATATERVVRYPGSPNEQVGTIAGAHLELLGSFAIVVSYTPEDDPPNGGEDGANPVRVILTLPDGSEIRLHHTFNVRHSQTWTWTIDDLRPYVAGQEITFRATASDVGSDDLTFAWDFGDGATAAATYYNNGVSPDPFPSPEVNPIAATDVQTHAFAVGTYTVTLTVTDDDGGTTTIAFVLPID